jgi:hypothetical protein
VCVSLKFDGTELFAGSEIREDYVISRDYDLILDPQPKWLGQHAISGRPAFGKNSANRRRHQLSHAR